MQGSLFELRSKRRDESKLPMKTFSAIKPRNPDLTPIRRSSLVAHEEAAFEVKVTAWQRKINAEDGTDHEVNLGKVRKRTSLAAEDVDVVVRRPKLERGNSIKRPMSSYGVNLCPRPLSNPTPTVDH